MSENYISAVSNSVETDFHKHWMLQLFLAYNNNLDIQVEDKKISCRCIIVDSNMGHRFLSCDPINFTMLIEPTSYIAKQFKEKYIKENSYYIFKAEDSISLQIELEKIIKNNLHKESYNIFSKNLFDTFKIRYNDRLMYDNRIIKLLEILEECDCSDHSVESFAKEVYLSKSRLSHLFKEQTGIPLKSYIVLHKLQKAYMYLFKGYNITYASIEAGFDSSSHFAYTNKKLTGRTAKNIIKDSVFLKVSDCCKK